MYWRYEKSQKNIMLHYFGYSGTGTHSGNKNFVRRPNHLCSIRQYLVHLLSSSIYIHTTSECRTWKSSLYRCFYKVVCALSMLINTGNEGQYCNGSWMLVHLIFITNTRLNIINSIDLSEKIWCAVPLTHSVKILGNVRPCLKITDKPILGLGG